MSIRVSLVAVLLGCVASVAFIGQVGAQDERLPSPRAALVNGEPVPESSVQRALKGIPPAQHAKARAQVLKLLIDNVLVEQFLVQQKVDAPAQEVAVRMEKIREEAKKSGQEYDKLLAQLSLTEADLRQQVAADLRWENHVKAVAPDDVLAKFFAENKNWFDGSQVSARHILLEAASNADAASKQAAVNKLQQIRQGIDATTAQELARLDPKADALVREQARVKAIGQVFADAASKHSDCPSKKHGGDLGFFPRVGAMVEPFAKAAFALQPGQIAGPVETQFGYHLILVTARMAGKDVKFDDMKDDIREIYSERMRDELVSELRKTAKIEVAAASPAENAGKP
jgi:parvulin-like peptidyl-prolyl isomerase